jgi:hypothetical protein
MTMSFAKSFISSFTAAALTLGVCTAADPVEVRKAETAPPTGEEILRLVRMSQALQDLKHLQGKLRNDDTGQEFPFDLTMADNVIRFVFADPPKEIINLDLNDNGTKLTRVSSGGKVEMPLSLYGEAVRKTAINFEDLSMRFLYWPNAKVIGDESISFQKCWIVRVANPDNRGPYRTVDVWVHKDSGAMMQMRAYDAKGKLLKEFKVRKGQKYKGAYILKQMRVESYNVDTNKINGRTYLEIDDPG